MHMLHRWLTSVQALVGERVYTAVRGSDLERASAFLRSLQEIWSSTCVERTDRPAGG